MKQRSNTPSSTDRIHVEEYPGSIPTNVKLLSSMFHLGKSLTAMAKMIYGATDASHKSKVNRELKKAMVSYPALFGSVKPPEKVNAVEFYVMANGSLTEHTHYRIESAIHEAQKVASEAHVPVTILRAVGIVKPTDIVITETTLSAGANNEDQFLGI